MARSLATKLPTDEHTVRRSRAPKTPPIGIRASGERTIRCRQNPKVLVFASTTSLHTHVPAATTSSHRSLRDRPNAARSRQHSPGRQSSLYIDARITTMSPDGLALIDHLALEDCGGRMERRLDWRADDGRGSHCVRDRHASASTSKPLRAFTARRSSKTTAPGS